MQTLSVYYFVQCESDRDVQCTCMQFLFLYKEKCISVWMQNNIYVTGETAKSHVIYAPLTYMYVVFLWAFLHVTRVISS